jgi:glucose-6-phosphate 1-dehydrogenase
VPDLGLDVRSVNMDFTYGSTFLSDAPEAYETLLLDAMLGDASLFTRADEVEAAWSLVTPLNEMWREWGAGSGDTKGKAKARAAPFGKLDGSIQPYEAGTWGPEAAERLLQRDGRRWRRL